MRIDTMSPFSYKYNFTIFHPKNMFHSISAMCLWVTLRLCRASPKKRTLQGLWRGIWQLSFSTEAHFNKVMIVWNWDVKDKLTLFLASTICFEKGCHQRKAWKNKALFHYFLCIKLLTTMSSGHLSIPLRCTVQRIKNTYSTVDTTKMKINPFSSYLCSELIFDCLLFITNKMFLEVNLFNFEAH